MTVKDDVKTAEEKAKDGAAFVVQHTRVGAHRMGDVIKFPEEKIKEMGKGGVDRLLRIGAIREAEGKEAKSAKWYGDTDEYALQPIPSLPPTEGPTQITGQHTEVVTEIHTEAATDAPVPVGADPVTVAKAKAESDKK